jgi:hypothetical protein
MNCTSEVPCPFGMSMHRHAGVHMCLQQTLLVLQVTECVPATCT